MFSGNSIILFYCFVWLFIVDLIWYVGGLCHGVLTSEAYLHHMLSVCGRVRWVWHKASYPRCRQGLRMADIGTQVFLYAKLLE